MNWWRGKRCSIKAKLFWELEGFWRVRFNRIEQPVRWSPTIYLSLVSSPIETLQPPSDPTSPNIYKQTVGAYTLYRRTNLFFLEGWRTRVSSHSDGFFAWQASITLYNLQKETRPTYLYNFLTRTFAFQFSLCPLRGEETFSHPSKKRFFHLSNFNSKFICF